MNSTLKHYSNRLESGVDKVRQLSKDFCSDLSLTLFGYVRIYNDGRMGWMTSDADHDRLLMDSGSLENEPLANNAQALKEGQYLWFHDREFPGSEAFYRDRARLFNVDHGMVIVKHQKDYLETACFSGSLKKQPLYNLFMNEAGLFNAFMGHFKQQLTPSLCRLLEEGLMISDIKSAFGQANVDNIHISNKLRASLLTACGWSRLLQLSPREKECLTQLRKGFSYSKIGSLLGLSDRTVEHYLDSAKNKLGLESRSELILAAEKLAQFGLI